MNLNKKLGILWLFLCTLLVVLPALAWSAPTVTDVVPAAGTVVPQTATVNVTFNEEMAANSVTTGSFSLTRYVGVKSAAAGYTHFLALRNDGTVEGWGSNESGQSRVPAGLSGVVAIAAGDSHSLALKEDGTVVAWGKSNVYGPWNVPAGLTGVKAIAAASERAVALKDDGTVITWGASGQPNVQPVSGITAIATAGNTLLALKDDGTVASVGNMSAPPAGLSDVTAISANFYHAVALKRDGTVVGWGSNTYGESTPPAGLSDVTAVAAGGYHTLALRRDGTVVAWGYNVNGQCNVPADLSGVVAIAAYSSNSIAVKNDGTVVVWGSGVSFRYQLEVPEPLTGVKGIAAGAGHVTTLTNDGIVKEWGDYIMPTPANVSGIKAVSAAGNHTLALKEDGTVMAWGTNNAGESNVPVNLSGVTAIAAGPVHSLALKGDGTVVGWSGHAVPAGLSGVVAIAAGGFHSSMVSSGHSVALKNNGTVTVWGSNSYGESTNNPWISGALGVGAGAYHTLVIRSNGTVMAWGNNTKGQCTVPAGLSGVVAVTGGHYHTLALKSDGTVVAWGDNSYGQCNVPAGLSGVVAIVAGPNNSLALKNDGTVVAWGDNTKNQLTVTTAKNPAESTVAGTVAYDAVSNSATFTPTVPLEPNASYFGTVNTGARNAAGVPVASDVRWGFVTGGLSVATIALSDLVHGYDGTPKIARAVTNPAGLPVALTYEGSAKAPSAPGAYHVEANVVIPNYQHYTGYASGMMYITNAEVHLSNLNQTYDGIAKRVEIITVPAGLTVTVTYGGSTTPPDKAGVYDVVATASGDGYFGVAMGVLTIDKGTPTIFWNEPGDITYGTPLGPEQLNAQVYGIPGTLKYSPGTGTVLDVGEDRPLTATFSPADTDNYYSAEKKVGITVVRATPTIFWPNPDPITYGTALSAAQLNAVPSVPGTIQYSPDFGTVLQANPGQTLTASFTPSDTARYTNATKSVNIDVLKANAFIVWATPGDITYGTLLSSDQLNAVANIPGSFNYSPKHGDKLNAGPNQALTATFTPEDTANYNVTPALVRINVRKASQALKSIALSAVSTSGVPVTYGLKEGSPATITVDETGTNLNIYGSGIIELNVVQPASNNYDAAPDVKWTIVVP